jgi:cytochrome P450
VTYFLLSNPEILEKLQKEVRSSFGSSSEINIMSVNNLPYMIAVLSESLRRYPPLTSGMVRIVPEHGMSIAGYPVPAGVSKPSTIDRDS